MKEVRPKRKAIPKAVKVAVVNRQEGLCRCGCMQPVSAEPRTGTKFDHRPALRLRDIAGDDYDPPQHSERHIDAICREEHDRRTFGTGATTAGSDAGNIKKERKRGRPPKPKRRWAKGRKLQSKPFQKRKP